MKKYLSYLLFFILSLYFFASNVSRAENPNKKQSNDSTQNQSLDEGSLRPFIDQKLETIYTKLQKVITIYNDSKDLFAKTKVNKENEEVVKKQTLSDKGENQGDLESQERTRRSN